METSSEDVEPTHSNSHGTQEGADDRAVALDPKSRDEMHLSYLLEDLRDLELELELLELR
jgi:hypothetical protein